MDNKKSKKKELIKRWKDKEDCVKEIINRLKVNDESWIQLVEDLKYIKDVKNGKDLRGINLEGVDFESINLKDIDLRYSNLRGANLYDADLSTTDLRGANLEDIKVNEGTDWGTYFIWLKEKRKETENTIKYIFMQYLIRFLGYKDKIYSEKLAENKEDYRSVKQIYKFLRKAYRIEDPTAADYFYYREYHCGMKLYPWWHPLLWFGLLWERTTCVGTAPLRTIISILLFILICSLFYLWVPNGIVRDSYLGCTENIKNIGEAFYFSVVTFTSLGYGDFYPDHDTFNGQCLKFLCNFEALIGILTLGIVAAMFLRFMTRER